MKLKKIEITNFRNIDSIKFFPNEGLNFFIGKNAQGKTSIIESIYYLSHLKSFRYGLPQDIIKQGENFSKLSCETIHNKNLTSELEINLFENENKTIKKSALINCKKISVLSEYIKNKSSQLASVFHSVSFNPTDHQLISGEPKIRREFINQALVAEDNEYLDLLKTYQKIIDQRNTVLKAKPVGYKNILKAFNEGYIKNAIEISLKRFFWIKKCNEEVNYFLLKIAPESEKIKLKYQSNVLTEDERENLNRELLYDKFCQKLDSNFELESRLCSTQLGPHRDDLVVNFKDKRLKMVGSQGEIRSILISLRLAEMELYYKVQNHYPLLLLDDFSSELDKVRRNFLLDFIAKSSLQVFITTTELVSSLNQKFWISNGNLLNKSDQNAESEIEL